MTTVTLPPLPVEAPAPVSRMDVLLEEYRMDEITCESCCHRPGCGCTCC